MAELTVASTTDTQEAINAAAGAPPEEPKVEVVEGEEAEKAPVEKAAEPEDRDSNKKAIAQKRIDRLTREVREKDAALSQVLQRLEKLEQGAPKETPPKPEEQAAAEKAAEKPKEADFQTWEEYQDALVDWKVAQKLEKMDAQSREQEAKEQQAASEKQMWDSYQEKVDEARERYDDWDEVASRNFEVPDFVGRAIVEGQLTDVVYYLGKHPDVCKKMFDMTPTAALTKLGQIAAQLEPVEEVEPSSAPTPKIKSRAAEPVRPVSGNSTKSTVPLDELEYAQYRKIRDRQEKERFRR